jgi:hypothetical protein
MTVTADTDLSTLTLEQINEMIVDAGSDVVATDAKFIQINASDEAQYEVTYFSPVVNENITNHVFVDIDPDGDPRLQINDFDIEEDLYPDD